MFGKWKCKICNKDERFERCVLCLPCLEAIGRLVELDRIPKVKYEVPKRQWHDGGKPVGQGGFKTVRA